MIILQHILNVKFSNDETLITFNHEHHDKHMASCYELPRAATSYHELQYVYNTVITYNIKCVSFE